MSAKKHTKINLWSTKHHLFREYPFVRLLLIYVAGILTSSYCNLSIDIVLTISTLVVIGAISFFIKSSTYLSVITFSLVFATGYSSVDIHTFLSSKKTTLPFGEITYYIGEVDQITKTKSNTYRLVLSQVHFKDRQDSSWKYYPDKVVTTLDTVPFQKGQYLLFKAKSFGFSASKNPDVFDYGAMMKRKGIGANLQIYSAIQPVPVELPYYKNMANNFTAKVIETVNGACENKNAANVILAMVLGKRDLVDQTQSTQFAYAGAMHLMAISGLHISILCGMLYFLFKPFRSKNARKISYILILLVIWTYAYVLSFPVSVVRASTMLSVFLLGNIVDRKGNAINTLACAAFLLLIIDPNALFDVGFQLSVMAVWGILVFYEPIYRLMAFKYTFVDYIWKTLSVSIAVQLSTFPIAVYYFHFYPVYGIITNVLIIPLCAMLLTCAFTGIVISFLWSCLGVLIVRIAGYATVLLNYIVNTAAAIPHAIIDDIYITSFEAMCLLAFSLFFVFAYSLRNAKLIYCALLSIMLFTFSRISNDTAIAQSNEIVFFSVYDHTAFVYREGTQAYIYLDEVLKEDPVKRSFSIEPYLKKRAVTSNYLDLHQNDKPYYYVFFNEISVLCVNDYLPATPLATPPDYVVLTNNAHLHPERLMLLPCSEMVLATSNGYRYVQTTKKQLSSIGFNVNDLKESALVERLK